MASIFGKILIFLGAIFILMGIFFLFFPHLPYVGKLPGDIYIKKDSFTFYFPLTSCILISLLLSLLFYLISRFLKW